MAELEETLAALLQNGGLDKIREFALPLLGNLAATGKDTPKQESPAPSAGPVIPETMAEPASAPALPPSRYSLPFDENMLNKVRSAIDMGGVGSSRHLSLLSALRPYLCKNRCDRLDSVQSILRFSGVIKAFKKM